MDTGLESGGGVIILLTVPRTGTGFFKKLLRQHFKLIGFSDARFGVGGLLVSHVSMSSIEAISDITNSIVVTTWRDWTKVKDSFIRHGDSLELFQTHFEAWEALVSKFDPIVLTVEDEYKGVSRETLLAGLGHRLGVNLETDWEPVNEWDKEK